MLSLSTFVGSFAILVAAQNTPGPSALPATFRTHQTKYYTIYSDLGDDVIREADMRITALAEEYHARTKHFSGRITERLPFYLFSNRDDYLAAGGLPKSTGVYRGDVLMAVVPLENPARTWQIVQHEGFHQFVDRVIGGDIPVWVNEGMAEYFEEGVYTGQTFYSGLAPKWKIEFVQNMIRTSRYRPFDDMLQLHRRTWNHEMSGENYKQAWSMVHFLAHGGGPQVRAAFDTFLVEVGKRGKDWQRAWIDSRLGPGTAQFEQMWRDYWLALDPEVDTERFAEAAVEAFALTALRAHAAGAELGTFAQFRQGLLRGELGLTREHSYPLGMAIQFLPMLDQLGTWRLEVPPRQRPIVACVRPDKRELQGFAAAGGKTVRVVKR